MSGLTDGQRERLQSATGHSGIFVRDVIAPVVAALLAEQREQIAREFEVDAARAWGDDASWLTTGSKVAALAAEWVRSDDA